MPRKVCRANSGAAHLRDRSGKLVARVIEAEGSHSTLLGRPMPRYLWRRRRRRRRWRNELAWAGLGLLAVTRVLGGSRLIQPVGGLLLQFAYLHFVISQVRLLAKAAAQEMHRFVIPRINVDCENEMIDRIVYEPSD